MRALAERAVDQRLGAFLPALVLGQFEELADAAKLPFGVGLQLLEADMQELVGVEVDELAKARRNLPRPHPAERFERQLVLAP